VIVDHLLRIRDIFLVEPQKGRLVQDGEERRMLLPEDVDATVGE